MIKCLFSPWRSSYSDDSGISKTPHCSANLCPFCKKMAQNNDKEHFILRRFDHNVVFLNLYPYNAGHLLIIPYDHKGELEDLSKETRAEMINLAADLSLILKKCLAAEGINIGINLGQSAGAGIPSHVHTHVLPRWNNDTNFLPVFGQVKQISYDLTTVYEKLYPFIHDIISI